MWARCRARKAARSSRCTGTPPASSASSRTPSREPRSPSARHSPQPFYGGRTSERRSMAEFKAVIADPKSGKTYKKDISGQFANSLVGRKLGEEIDGLYVGLPGYKLAITGGSDKDGFPMRGDVPGPRRRRILLSGGVGVYSPREGGGQKKDVPRDTTVPDTLPLN